MTRPVAEIVKAVKRSKVNGAFVLGDRVFPGAVPPSTAARTYPFCVVRRAGGATVPTGFTEGGPVPLVSIQVLDTDYERMDAVMREIELQVQTLAYSVFDPPDDEWHDALQCYQQTITVTVQQ